MIIITVAIAFVPIPKVWDKVFSFKKYGFWLWGIFRYIPLGGE